MNLTQKRISQLGRVVTGKTSSTSRREFFGGEYLFITPSDLHYSHYYCRQAEHTVTEEAKSVLPRQFIPAETKASCFADGDSICNFLLSIN